MKPRKYEYKISSNLANIKSLRKLESLLGCKREFILEVASKCTELYRPYDKKKREKVRTIDNPIHPLKHLQNKIDKNLLKPIPPHKAMYGGVTGKSIVKNAQPHVGQPVILKLDISKYFPNTSDKKVFDLFHRKLGYTPRLAGLLTRITTYNHYLPQGAPTSTTLANLINSPMCHEIYTFCVKRELKLSFWVDDITISGKNPQQYLKFFKSRVRAHGYSLNSKQKTLKNNTPQMVTGVNVNKKISVPKEKMKKYTDEIFMFSKDKKSGSETKILGKIQHTRDINPKSARRLMLLKQTLKNRSK